MLVAIVNPKLLPRLKKSISPGRNYLYSPMSDLSKVEGLAPGTKVMVIGKPRGRKNKVIEVVTKDHKQFTVLMEDLIRL